MGITQVKIRNYKSIKNLKFKMEQEKYDIQCLLGKNGSGKSSFLDAISYYYLMLSGDNIELNNVIDNNNKFIQSCEIEIEYDFSNLILNNSNIYYEEKMGELEKFIINSKLRLKMIQSKNGNIKWYPAEINYNLRKLWLNHKFCGIKDF